MRALNQPNVQKQIAQVVLSALSSCGVGNYGTMEMLWHRDGLLEGQVTGFSVAFTDRVNIREEMHHGVALFQMYYIGLAGTEPEPLGEPICGWRAAADKFVVTLAERRARLMLRQRWDEIDRNARRPIRDTTYSTLPPKRFGM